MVSNAQREQVPAETPDSPFGSPRCNQIFQSQAVQTQAPRGPISAQCLPVSPTTERLTNPERKEKKKRLFLLLTQLTLQVQHIREAAVPQKFKAEKPG